MSPETLAAILSALGRGEARVRALDLDSGAERLVDPAAPSDPLARAAGDAARANVSGMADIAGRRWFLEVHQPQLRLYVVGAVHIAQALCPIASLAGFDVTVIDPRAAFATAARFPGVTLSTEWPDEAFARLPLTTRTAVVALTHDPKLDDPALSAALKSRCFYVGALGSKKTHAARRERLKAHGFEDAVLDRIHGPIGLRIGAQSPGEIAVAIAAEMIAVQHGAA